MSIPAAYVGLILIWSTTPLAIKWSGEGVGFLFGATARMALGALACLLLLRLLRIALPWDSNARRGYAAGALGIFGAMLCTYWGAQRIPSGLVSVLFGTSPLLTGILASLLLGERAFSPMRVVGMALGMVGLLAIFRDSIALGDQAGVGIGAVLGGAFLHALSGVLVKRSNAQIHPMALNTGALLLAVCFYLPTWGISDGQLPQHAEPRTWLAIGYLALLGTAVGFNLYFYALRHLSAGTMSLIPLLTPVLALLIGMGLNGEQPGWAIWAGSAAILLGLTLHQFGERLLPRLRPG